MRFLRACQKEDGSFSPTEEVSGAFQNDARMSYCASIARAVLRAQGVEGDVFEVAQAREFVERCKVSFVA